MTHETTQKLSRQQFLRGAVALTLASGSALSAHAQGTTAPATDAASDRDAAPKGPTSSRFVLLGTVGGPVLRKFRSQPANLLVVDGHMYLIDAGYGSAAQMVRAGFHPRDLTAVFLTHLHSDHTMDLPNILNFALLAGRTEELPIYGPPGTEKLVNLAQDYTNEAIRVFTEQLPRGSADFAKAEVQTNQGLMYSDERIKIYTGENTHYQTFAHGNDKSYSFRIECPDRVIFLTGDSGPSQEILKLAQGADVLVSEVIDADAAVEMVMRTNHLDESGRSAMQVHMNKQHLSPEEIGQFAQSAGVKMVVLTHFVPGEDTETNFDMYTAGVKMHFNGPVIAGRDLLEI